MNLEDTVKAFEEALQRNKDAEELTTFLIQLEGKYNEENKRNIGISCDPIKHLITNEYNIEISINSGDSPNNFVTSFGINNSSFINEPILVSILRTAENGEEPGLKMEVTLCNSWEELKKKIISLWDIWFKVNE